MTDHLRTRLLLRSNSYTRTCMKTDNTTQTSDCSLLLT